MAEKVTADYIREALTASYCEPEWYLGFEVGNSTGANCRRHADAVAINAYPSRGYEVRGFEIKVSRSDLQQELDNGIKAEMVAQHCNYWYLVVPKGLTENMMIPAPWGILEYSDGKLRQKKKPTYRETAPDMGFLMAFLRGWTRQKTGILNKERMALKEQERKLISNEVRWELKTYEELKAKVIKFRDDTGIDLRHGVSNRERKAFKIGWRLVSSDLSERDFDYHLKEITRMCETIKKVCAEIKELSGLEGTDDIRRV